LLPHNGFLPAAGGVCHPNNDSLPAAGSVCRQTTTSGRQQEVFAAEQQLPADGRMFFDGK
jgi:hypothetical protein